MSIEEALGLTELTIRREDGEWILYLEGFPREWLLTKDEADERAPSWRHMKPVVQHAAGPTWLVFGGDQYLFSGSSREEAEGFVFGVAVGQAIARNGTGNT